VSSKRIYVDHGLTGRNRDRPGLREALAACRAGDTLVVTKFDRLARSLPDARDIVEELTAAEVRLNIGGSVHDRPGRTVVVQRPHHDRRILCYVDTASLRGEARGGCWTGGVRVAIDRVEGVVASVSVVDSAGAQVAEADRFLAFVLASGGSPNTALAYGYDLRYLFEFLDEGGLDWTEFSPAVALELLGWLRRRPSRRAAQRLGLGVAEPQGRLLAPATVARVLSAVSSFYEWAIVAEVFEGENPMRRRPDPALALLTDRHRPFAGAASRQQPTSREVRVRLPVRLPRPLSAPDVVALLDSMRCLRDLAMVLLMLDGGLRPGEVLGLHLDDLSYGRRRVTVRKRDDHPRGARGKSRSERVVDLLEDRTLDAVNRYVLHERPLEAQSPFVFLVGGKGPRRGEPLSYAALARMFARRLDAVGLRSPDKTPHALRHTHATAMWEAGMRELALQRRLGHASPESTRIYTRVSDARVRDEYATALRARR
jgi:integrase/recombinase XerD